MVTDQIYHVYNRGAEKRHIFESRTDYKRFIKSTQYYLFKGPKPKFSHFSQEKISKLRLNDKICDILAYCLMPNHFHLLLKQNTNGGITEFLSKLSNSYTKYFNLKYDRVGALFQGEFKSVLIESDEQLVHVSRYIHLNPVASFLVTKPENWEWSSYMEYLDQNSSGFCQTTQILGLFKDSVAYRQFVEDQIAYAQELEIIKHQLIEEI